MASVLVSLPRLEVGPPASGETLPLGPTLQRWEDGAGRLIATGGRGGDGWWMHWSGLATYRFGEAGDVSAEPIRAGLEREVHDIFTRAVMPVVLLARGFEVLHASAVLGPSGVIGLCGISGTGKSTLAFALTATGLPHYADDTVVYRLVGDQPVALSIPFPVRVEVPAHLAVGLGATPRPPSVGSSRSAPFKRIYQLARDATLDPLSPTFVPLPPEKRFPLLLAHAHPFDMGTRERRRAFLENLMTLARTVDVWECRFAPDLAALPSLAAAIRTHISQQ